MSSQDPNQGFPSGGFNFNSPPPSPSPSPHATQSSHPSPSQSPSGFNVGGGFKLGSPTASSTGSKPSPSQQRRMGSRKLKYRATPTVGDMEEGRKIRNHVIGVQNRIKSVTKARQVPPIAPTAGSASSGMPVPAPGDQGNNPIASAPTAGTFASGFSGSNPFAFASHAMPVASAPTGISTGPSMTLDKKRLVDLWTAKQKHAKDLANFKNN